MCQRKCTDTELCNCAVPWELSSLPMAQEPQMGVWHRHSCQGHASRDVNLGCHRLFGFCSSQIRDKMESAMSGPGPRE